MNDMEAFLNYVLNECKVNPAARAAFRRAGNPDTEFYAYEYIADWCDLNNDKERRIYSLFSSFIADAMPESIHGISLGKGLKSAYDDGSKNPSALSQMRRIISCRDWNELLPVLRRVLLLLASKRVKLDLVSTMKDVFFFGDKVKVKWAADFYQNNKK